MENETRMSIREFEPPDTRILNSILSSQYPWNRYQTEFSVTTDEVSSTGVCSMIEVDGETAGFVWFMEDGLFDRSGYIKMLGIEEQYQNMQAGSRIMDHAEAELSKNCPDVFLLVSGFNDEAQRFYRSRGYTKIGKISDYVEPGIDEILLRYD